MRRVIVRYKVFPDRAEENKVLIKKVFDELAATQPPGLRYASYQGTDGVSFFHFALIETDDQVNPLDGSVAFKAFQEGIRERCEIPPEAIEISEIGSYNFFGG